MPGTASQDEARQAAAVARHNAVIAARESLTAAMLQADANLRSRLQGIASGTEQAVSRAHAERNRAVEAADKQLAASLKWQEQYGQREQKSAYAARDAAVKAAEADYARQEQSAQDSYAAVIGHLDASLGLGTAAALSMWQPYG